MTSRPDSGADDSSRSQPTSPDDLLPAVQPPSAGFILQLFFIPLIIVSIIVAVWLLFSWLASAGNDPKDLVRDLKKLNDARWQKAVSLADQLRNPANDHLKDDAELASQLAAILEMELDSGRTDPAHLKLRIFLCKALGEFRVTAGNKVLVRAAGEPKEPDEIEVRAAALEAFAVLAHNVGAEKLREDEQVFSAVLAASQDMALDSDTNHAHAEVRSRAAFTLGVLGGQRAVDRLEEMLSDAYPNTRYNAAIGLARHGDVRAEKVLTEMLNPTNSAALQNEKSDSERKVKRTAVQLNAVRAVEELVAQHSADAPPPEAVGHLQEAVRQLAAHGETPQPVKRVATEILQRWNKKS